MVIRSKVFGLEQNTNECNKPFKIICAGSLLGEIQHGHMEQVGYDMYCKLLDEVVKEIQEAHKRNEMGIIFLSTTNHQNYHSNEGSTFISLNQCYGNPFAFIDKFSDGLTMGIAYTLLLQLKKEEQYNGKSFTPLMSKARDTILSWQNSIY